MLVINFMIKSVLVVLAAILVGWILATSALGIIKKCSDAEVTKTSKIGIFAPEITENDKKTIEVAREQCKIRFNKCLKKVEIVVAKDGSTIYTITCSGELK